MNTQIWLILGTALTLGFAHAFEPDHLAAVTSFVVGRPHPRSAFMFGIRWALGHGTSILVVGLLVVLLGLSLPAQFGPTFDRIAGAALVALGIWTALGARRVHAHRHTHDDGTVHAHVHAHVHVHAAGATHSRDHDHAHGVTAIGALHGLAGTAPVVALLPLVGIRSPAMATGYLVAFGVGVALSMGLYALLAGWVAGKAALRSQMLARGLMIFVGGLTVVVGTIWIIQ
jgi:ABC-type nickel/cobalt efflux system permease component RcnA